MSKGDVEAKKFEDLQQMPWKYEGSRLIPLRRLHMETIIPTMSKRFREEITATREENIATSRNTRVSETIVKVGLLLAPIEEEF
eukprot:scaffold2153_cov131-Cylindrotheca_fusiformis.AAC.1